MSHKFAILPFKSRPIKDRFLLITTLGDWAILNKEDFRRIHSYSISEDSKLFKQLKAKRIIVDETNLKAGLQSHRRLNANLSRGVGLHIAVLTEACNFSCKYCQTKEEKSPSMDIKVAARVLDCLLRSNSRAKTLEFQGGEPLLCWDTLKWFIETVSKINHKLKQNIKLSLVSNLTLLDKDKLNFLIDHKVNFCTSLDGPEALHDQQRVYVDARATYVDTTKKIEEIRQEYKKRNIKKTVGLLPTITKNSLSFSAKEIIDEYLKWKVSCIPLRFVNPLKKASKNWQALGYSPDEFNQFWKEGLDYIIDLNKKGTFIYERTAQLFLKKILAKKDPFYVDLVSPCGGGRNTLAYMPNGDVYTCDEARMIKSDLFKLGNLLKNSYVDIMKSPNLFGICQSSLLELWDYSSPYSVWSGTCPVMNFFQQGNPVVKISQSPHYKIHNFQLDYLTEKIYNDKMALAIFKRWSES